MKQRVAVAVALATVWLASIVGASVPSGETTAFSTPRPPGPSPDQYTPLLGSPRYYPQDDYGQDWMNDEPSRIKVANRQGNSDRGQTTITHLDRSLEKKSSPDAFFNEPIPQTPYQFRPNDKTTTKITSDAEREAIRLASMKVAFDDPIDSEMSNESSKEEDDDDDENWTSEDLVEDERDENYESTEEAMQQDEFVSDDTFEDEGPGSVEVYKLDLFKDRSILNEKPLKQSTKNKMPKKVVAGGDQMIWKSHDMEDPKPGQVKKIMSKYDRDSREFLTPSKNFKERIFGVGGVPELQVGCEGVEAIQRQKRSDFPQAINSDKTRSNVNADQAGRSAPLYIDVNYDSEEEEELDTFGATDELFKILSAASTTTDSTLINKNRGDMDPRVKTPADLAVKRKDKLPLRGDLGPDGDPNLNDGIQPEGNITKENQNIRRKLLSLKEAEEDEEEEEEEGIISRNKRSSATTTFQVTNERRRRGRRVHDRNIRRLHRGEADGIKRRRRQNGRRRERTGGRKENEIRRRHNDKPIDKTREDYFKSQENRAVKHPSNSLTRQMPTASRRTHRPHRRQQHDKRLTDEKLLQEAKERKIKAENARKLEEYKRRNTPIQKLILEQKRPKTESISKAAAYENDLRNEVPFEINTNRDVYDKELERLQNDQRASTERSTEYRPRSAQEIARLNALPVSAQIIIREDDKPDDSTPKIESRWNDNDISFPGLNPSSTGREVPQFPVPATERPPSEGPSPCAWAIMTCCSNQKRLATCFETKGCVGAHWDPDACSQKNVAAAIYIVKKYVSG